MRIDDVICLGRHSPSQAGYPPAWQAN